VHRCTLRVLAASAVVTLLPACRHKPAARESCKAAGQLVCAGTHVAFECEALADGRSVTWIEIPCKGSAGCSRHGNVDECDDTKAVSGDPCPRGTPLDYACTPDRAQALVCRDGRFGLWRQCRGSEGCQVVEGRNVRCDTSLGEPSDPCAQKGTYACSADRQSMLVCDGTTLTPASSCRGPDGCRIQRDGNRVDCDDSVAMEGDFCEEARRIACSTDRKAELVCQSNRYERKRECRRGNCRLEGTELFCE
jgi:hypothetical protein